jgi:hypothetical protein
MGLPILILKTSVKVLGGVPAFNDDRVIVIDESSPHHLRTAQASDIPGSPNITFIQFHAAGVDTGMLLTDGLSAGVGAETEMLIPKADVKSYSFVTVAEALL